MGGVNGWVVVESDGTVNCNRGRAGPWEKFSGWTQPFPWDVDKIEFNLNAGKTGSSKPVVLGRIVNDNRGGSVERTRMKEFKETIAETSTFSHTAGVGIEVGTTFST